MHRLGSNKGRTRSVCRLAGVIVYLAITLINGGEVMADDIVNSGEQLYGQMCSMCHGPEGMGTSMAPAIRYVYNRFDFTGLADTIRLMMPPPGNMLTNEQSVELATYLYTLGGQQVPANAKALAQGAPPESTGSEQTIGSPTAPMSPVGNFSSNQPSSSPPATDRTAASPTETSTMSTVEGKYSLVASVPMANTGLGLGLQLIYGYILIGAGLLFELISVIVRKFKNTGR